MVLFKTKSGQNNTSKRNKLHQSFKKFPEEHAPETHKISVTDITIYFYIKVAIFYSEFFQNIK